MEQDLGLIMNEHKSTREGGLGDPVEIRWWCSGKTRKTPGVWGMFGFCVCVPHPFIQRPTKPQGGPSVFKFQCLKHNNRNPNHLPKGCYRSETMLTSLTALGNLLKICVQKVSPLLISSGCTCTSNLPSRNLPSQSVSHIQILPLCPAARLSLALHSGSTMNSQAEDQSPQYCIPFTLQKPFPGLASGRLQVHPGDNSCWPWNCSLCCSSWELGKPSYTSGLFLSFV